MRRCGTLLTLLLFALVVGGTSHAARTDVTSEKGVDRPGMDYRSFWLPKDDPELCRQACADDEKCKAYTYRKPSVQGGKARCLLKGRVPSAKRNDCCVSGVKLTKSPTVATSPPAPGPAAKMTAPPVRGSQVAPKVQADRFSPKPIGTITPPVVKGDEVIYKREPFWFTKNVEIKPRTYTGSESIKVSDEHLFVIETISVSCSFGPGKQPGGFWIRVVKPETAKDRDKDTPRVLQDFEYVVIRIPLSKQYVKDSGVSGWVGTQQVRTYALPGTWVNLSVSSVTIDTTNSTFCACSLSGYQLDPDSPSLAP